MARHRIGPPKWTAPEIRELMARLRDHPGEPRLTRRTTDLVIAALGEHAARMELTVEDLTVTIEEHDSDGRPMSVIAMCRNAYIGHAAYREAVKQHKGRTVVLRQVSHVIRQSDRDPDAERWVVDGALAAIDRVQK